MNTRALLFAAAFVPAAAFATDFTTLSFQTSDGSATAPNVGQSFSSSGNSYTASFTNFVLGSRPYIDVAWTHRFDTTVATPTSPASPPYGAVTQIVTGRVRRAAGTGTGTVNVSTVLSESITDAAGAPVGGVSATRNFTGTTDGATYITFQLAVTTPFSRPLSVGFAIKDDLVVNSDANSSVIVDSIEQRYQPVPEPASMLALAGGLGLLARRRRRS